MADPETLEAAALDAVPAAVEASVRRSLGGGESRFVYDADEATVHRWEARPITALDVAGTEYLADALPDWRGRLRRGGLGPPPTMRDPLLRDRLRDRLGVTPRQCDVRRLHLLTTDTGSLPSAGGAYRDGADEPRRNR